MSYYIEDANDTAKEETIINNLSTLLLTDDEKNPLNNEDVIADIDDEDDLLLAEVPFFLNVYLNNTMTWNHTFMSSTLILAVTFVQRGKEDRSLPIATFGFCGEVLILASLNDYPRPSVRVR